MKKRRHKRDKKITILRPIPNDTPYGLEDKYEPMPGAENIWAYYRHASGKEFYAARAYNTKVEVIFEIAWRDDITTDMQVRYKNQDYTITQIDDFEGYKRTLTISAYKVN